MARSEDTSTPFQLGFRMPAEWEPHVGTWLCWPHELTDWEGKYAVIVWVYAEIIRVLTRVERVYLLVQDSKYETRAKRFLKKAGVDLSAVDFLRIETDRGWMRDSGPICVRNEEGILGFNHFKFNAWAAYENYKKDALTVGKINAKKKYRSWQPMHNGKRVVLEGGSIDVNGSGSLLTTEECLLSTIQERNPGFTKTDYETVFREYLGVTNVLWLDGGIVGDDTHGHVDDLARFVSTDTVVMVLEEDPADENYRPLKENLKRLESMRDENGTPLKVETLPMPGPVIYNGRRMPASYANFYIGTGIVIVPTFNDPNDRIALNTLTRLFPQHEVVGIFCRDLVVGYGTLHCMSQQFPDHHFVP
jgi:agmatine deiminase